MRMMDLALTNHKQASNNTTMTIDNKHNFADAQVLLDSDYFPSSANSAPIAEAVLIPDEDSKVPAVVPVETTTTETTVRVTNGTAPRARDPDMMAHNEQHRKNVVTGVVAGVVIGAIILGPIGAIAGGFIGSSIVNNRERRWCHRHGGFRRHHHGFHGRRGSRASHCRRW